jgi:superfamily II DNA or RNA helicase
MALRPYQHQAIEDLRQKFREGKTRILYQLATGGGKSVVFSEITRLATAKKLRVWILVPRKKLLRQASNHLSSIKIPHGRINADCKESRAYNVHCVSQPTLLRRMAAGKIKNWPKIVVVDECHLSLSQQLRIRDAAPDGTVFVGCTATPRETSGRGLSEMYEDIILGPKFSDLVSMDYLSKPRYFCPPFDFDVKKRGDDYDAKAIEEILAARQVYGKVISHYRELAQGKPTLVFCPSVKNSQETAQRFCDAGFKAEYVNGTMPEKKIESIIKALETGKIDIITSCDLVTFGVSIDILECIILLRKTMSITLFFQMIGRGTRVMDGKDGFLVLDHCGNFREHAIGQGDSIEERFDIDWRELFFGEEKNKRKKGEVVASLKLCDSCFMYYDGPACPNCGAERGKKPPKKYEEIDGRLIEITGPVKLNDRPLEEKREFQDKYSELMESITGADTDELMDKYVNELLKLAADAGLNAMSVYWRLSQGMRAVNVPVLHSIKRTLGYKPGWIWMQKKVIERKLGR